MSDYDSYIAKLMGGANDEEDKKSNAPKKDAYDSYMETLGLTEKAPEPPHKGSFTSDIKRGYGNIASSFGSALQDVGAPELGKKLEAHGESYVQENPSEIKSAYDLITKPLTTLREAIGEQIPQLPLQAIGAAGTWGRGTQYAINMAQAYGGIRSEQRKSGDESIPAAIAGGVASGVLETTFGTGGLLSSLGKKGGKELLEKGFFNTIKNTAKEEFLTEVAQTGVERGAAFKGLLDSEALNEYAIAGVKGALGGGGIGGGVHVGASILGGGADRKDSSLLAGTEGDRNSFNTPDADSIKKALNIVGQEDVLDTQAAVNQALGIVEQTKKEEQAAHQARIEDIKAAFNEPTGQRVVDPQTGLERELTAFEAQQLQLGNPVQAQQVAQQQKAAAVEKQETAQLVNIAQTYGAVANKSNGIDIAGKRLYGPEQTKQFLTELSQFMQGRSETDMSLASAAIKSGLANIKQTAGVKQLVNAIGKVLDTYQVGHADSVQEAADTLNDQISRLEGASALKEADRINSLYTSLMGTSAPAYDTIQAALAAEQPKGASNERKLQTTTGMGTIPVQGSTNETSGTRDGGIRPTSVQPVGARSVGEGSLGLQVGTVPSQGVSTSTGASTTTSGIQPIGQGQGQINVQPPQTTGKTSGRKTLTTKGKQSSGTATAGAKTVGGQEQTSNLQEPVTIGSKVWAQFNTDGIPYSLLKTSVPAEYVSAWEKAAAQGLATKEAYDYLVDFTKVKDETFSSLWPSLLESVVKDPVKREFMEKYAYIKANLREETMSEYQKKLGITIDQAKQWSREAQNFGTHYAKSIAKAIKPLAAKFDVAENVFSEKLYEVIYSNRELESEATMAKDEVRAETTQTAIETARDREDTEAVTERAKKSISIAERGNKKEGINTRVEEILSALDDEQSKPEQDQDAKLIEKLNADLEKVLAPTIKKRKPLKEAKTEEQNDEELWDKLNAPVAYKDLSIQAKADWAVSVKEGKTNLAAASKVFEDNQRSIEFSKGQGKNGSSADAVRQEIKDFISAENTRKVEVFQSISDLPINVRIVAAPDKTDQAFVYKNKAYLIADNIAEGRARAVFMHEVGSHLGIQRMLTEKQFDHLVDTVLDWAGRQDKSIESTVAQAALKRASGVIAEQKNTELIAYFIEEAMIHGIDPTANNLKTPIGRWFRTLWAAFKLAVRRVNMFDSSKLDAQDFVNLAFGAAKLEITGTWHGTAAAFRKFSHKFMSTGEGAQAFGWGTYLAQRAGIAHQYWKTDVKNKSNITKVRFQGETHKDLFKRAIKDPSLYRNPEFVATQAILYSFVEHPYQTAQEAIDRARAMYEEKIATNALGTTSGLNQKSLDFINNIDPKDIALPDKPKGNLMRVDYNARTEELLDLDKPLSKQPYIQELIRNYMPTDIQEALMEKTNLDFNEMTGRDVYFGLKSLELRNGMVSENGLPNGEADKAKKADEVVSIFLDNIGIKGNQFADATSRKNTPEAKVTKNIVIFNDKNLFRVASLVGAKTEQIQFSKAAEEADKVYKTVGRTKSRARQNIKRLPPVLRGPAGAIYDALFNTKEVALGVMILEDVADLARKWMPSVDKYLAVKHLRTEIETKLQEPLDKIMLAAQSDLSDADRNKVNRILEDSTISGKWAFDPKIQGAVVDPVLASRFKELTPAAQKTVRDVFTYFRSNLEETKAAINEMVETHFANRVIGAKDDAARKQIEKEKASMRKQFSGILDMNKAIPYAPLKRHGDFVVTAKSKEYLEAERNGDKKALQELRADEKHYVVEFAETLSEAMAMQDKLEETGSYAQVEDPFKKAEYKDALYSGADLYKGFAKLKAMVATQRETEGGTAVLNRLSDMVNELYLLSLAESSARKSEMQKEGIAGYNRAVSDKEGRDMLRAAFTQGSANAKYISSLKTSDQALDAIVSMQKESGANRAESHPYLNEIMAREAQSLQVRKHSSWDMANRLTGDWFLTFSPSFYFQQMSQTYVLSLPWLAGKFGEVASFNAISKAYMDVLPITKGMSIREHLDAKAFPEDVRGMITDLINRGRINFGVDSELVQHRSGGKNIATATYVKTTNKLRGIINRIEAINRSTAAIAAYRLEMKQSGDKVKANKAADDVVRKTHGLYDGSNTPRHFSSNPIMKSVSQFKRFQVIQLTTLFGIAHSMFKHADPIERGIARRQFMYMTIHSLVLAGVKGLPYAGLLGVIYTLANAAFGDDDDPEDFEAWLRKHGGVLLARGFPANFGLDLSNVLGQGKTMSLLPYTDVDLTSKVGVEKVLLGLAGPFIGGLLPKFGEGLGYLASGDYYRGLENTLPKGVSDAIKATRISQHGITKKNGDVLIPASEITFLQSTMQAVGLPTSTLTERQYLESELIKHTQFFKDRTTELKREYTEAKEAQDTIAMQQARDEWKALQEKRAEDGFKRQPLSELLKAPQEKRKRERQTAGGVQYNKQSKKFVRNRLTTEE